MNWNEVKQNAETDYSSVVFPKKLNAAQVAKVARYFQVTIVSPGYSAIENYALRAEAVFAATYLRSMMNVGKAGNKKFRTEVSVREVSTLVIF